MTEAEGLVKGWSGTILSSFLSSLSLGGEGGGRNMCPPMAGMPPSVLRPVNSAWYGSVSRLGLFLAFSPLAAVVVVVDETRVVSEPLSLAMTLTGDLDDLRRKENILGDDER